MFLIWAMLLFAVRSNNAKNTEKPLEKTAEAGLCVVIPCDFTNCTQDNAVWHKCDQKCTDSDVIFHKDNQKVQSGFKDRVSLLENCSIIINDLTKSDSGSYQLKGPKEMGEDYICRTTITVQDLTQKPTVMIPPLTEGQQSTLTCTAPGLCSGSDPQITWTWRGAGENDSHITGNITKFKTENLTAVTQRHNSTLTFNPSAEHHGTNVTCKVSFINNITTEKTVTLNVTYVKKSGEKTESQCDTESCKVPSNKTMHSGTETDPETNTKTATPVTSDVTAEHSMTTVTMSANATKTSVCPTILNSSGCINELGVMTCMCISQGFPLPTIRWPLLANHTDYLVTSTVSNHTINSTVILAVKDQSNIDVECVSSNGNQEVNRILIMSEVKEKGQIINLLGIVTRLEVMIAFFIGALLSAIICCLAGKCNRKKQRTYGYLPETLEMVTCHEDPLMDAGQVVEDDQAIDHQAAEAEGAVATAKQDVEYSNLDFSLVKRQSRAEAGTAQGAAETEYAEIKKGKAKARVEGEEEEEKMGEDEEMMGEDEEIKDGVPDEEEGESEALYSTVKEVLDEI